MDRYYVLHLPTGLQTELIASDFDTAEHILRGADFYILDTNIPYMSYTWYKQDSPWFVNSHKQWLPKALEQFEIICSNGKTFSLI